MIQIIFLCTSSSMTFFLKSFSTLYMHTYTVQILQHAHTTLPLASTACIARSARLCEVDRHLHRSGPQAEKTFNHSHKSWSRPKRSSNWTNKPKPKKQHPLQSGCTKTVVSLPTHSTCIKLTLFFLTSEGWCFYHSLCAVLLWIGISLSHLDQ